MEGAGSSFFSHPAKPNNATSINMTLRVFAVFINLSAIFFR
jgi:hypothetical protein